MTSVAELSPLWVTSRAAGTAALVCSSLTIAAGLLMALKPAFLRRRRIELRAAHEAFALATFALIAIHATSLLLDPVLDPSAAQLLVPFAAAYARVGTALGQLAAYGMLGLGLTFYVRRRLGTGRWRRAHRAIPVFWALAIGHALLTGTDAWSLWFLAALAIPVLAGVALLVERHAGEPSPGPEGATAGAAGARAGRS